MKTLKFLPVPGHLVQTDPPGSFVTVGQPRNYLGYKFNFQTHEHELTGQPFEVEAGSPLAKRLLKAVRDGGLVLLPESSEKLSEKKKKES